MIQATQRIFREHLITSEHFFDADIGKWHVRCSITKPGGHELGIRACPNPMYVADESQAIEASLAHGERLVTAGMVW